MSAPAVPTPSSRPDAHQIRVAFQRAAGMALGGTGNEESIAATYAEPELRAAALEGFRLGRALLAGNLSAVEHAATSYIQRVR
jgi:hypothetical protein